MKSRNLIPGWPRGRSTSRPIPGPYFNPDVAALCDFTARVQEQLVGLAEGRRKADIMEAWYEVKRWEAGGNLWPQSLSEWITWLLSSSSEDIKLVQP